MQIRRVVAGVVLGAAVVGGGIAGIMAVQPAEARNAAAMAETFTVDPVHSMVFFRIGHLGVAYTYGRFNEPTGEFIIDMDSPGASMIDITLKADEVDTGNAARDKHLRSGDFFNAKQYPEITFTSKSFEKTGSDTMRVTGDLTMHGVTKPVTAEIDYVGEGETPQGYKGGFEARFKIKRSDFGMTKFLENDMLGDEVTLMVTAEGKKG